jgi:hypothetical protein
MEFIPIGAATISAYIHKFMPFKTILTDRQKVLFSNLIWARTLLGSINFYVIKLR